MIELCTGYNLLMIYPPYLNISCNRHNVHSITKIYFLQDRCGLSHNLIIIGDFTRCTFSACLASVALRVESTLACDAVRLINAQLDLRWDRRSKLVKLSMTDELW